MKKFLVLSTISLLAFSGCKLAEDAQTSYENVIKEKDKVVEGFNKSKENIEEKIEEVEEAANAIQNATDKLKDIGE